MASKGIVFVNGKFFPAGKAALSVSDLTVQRGYGANDVFRTYNHLPFMLDEHLRRLRKSVRLMMMKNVPTEAAIRKVIAAGLRKTRGEVLVKILVTGGPGNHISPLGRPGLVVYFLPFHAHPESDYKRGFRMITTRSLRILPAAKSIDYYAAILAQITAERRGFDEAIFYDGKRLLEGTTFSIGVIIGQDLIVPKADVLEGITMLGAIRAAARVGLRVRRRDVTFADLKKADEMFSTSTIREVLPVVQVDKIKIGNGKPGKYSKLLLQEFRRLANSK